MRLASSTAGGAPRWCPPPDPGWARSPTRPASRSASGRRTPRRCPSSARSTTGTRRSTRSTRENAEGYWYADVPGAKIGDEYRFILKTPWGELSQIDPYAREVTNSVGNGVVHDPHFDWGEEFHKTPPWNEWVIYELHVGTFNDENPDDPQPAHVRQHRPPLRPPEEARRELPPGHAGRGVRRRPLVGVQPGAHLRRRERLRRAEDVQGVRPRGPPATGSRSSSTWSTTTSARPTSTCGGSTAGARTTAAASTSTRTGGRRRRGATPARTTAAPRCGSSSATTR